MKWDGERDTKEYEKKCEEQRRESLDFRSAEGVRQRLEKEDKAANDLCEKSSEKNKATSNDIGNDLPTSTVLLLKKPTVTSLFSRNKPTLGTGGVPELETAKEIKKYQNNRAYIDQLKKQDIICSEVVDTKSYDLSTVFEEEQYRNNIPTKKSNKNLGTVQGKYDNKLRIVKFKDKKDSVHRKKKVTTTNANLPVL